MRVPRNPLLSDPEAPMVGRIAEKRTARRLGAVLHRASGALDRKADMTLRGITVENKSTQKQSVSVKLSWLLDVWAAAREQGNEPAVAIQFTNASGVPLPKGRWVMLPEDFLQDLLALRGVDEKHPVQDKTSG